MKERFLKEARGFSLVEMMVTIIIMIVVFFALYSIFDMGLRVYAFGNNKAEAMENARLGVEKMEREIRGAYKYNSGASQNHLFFTTASPDAALTLPAPNAQGRVVVNQLTFGNDMGGPGAGNGIIQCGSPCEYITYKLTDDEETASVTSAPCTTAPCTLRRVNTNNSNNWGDPVVENVAANGLSFTLLKSDGGTPASEGEVGIVLVSLNIVVGQNINTRGTQTLTTAIDLRNRQ